MKFDLKKEIIEWVKTLAIALALALLINTVVTPTIVKGVSMYPTLDENNYLLIYKLAYINKTPKRGDIIVFKSDLETSDGKKKDLVKRVIGLPGDEVLITNGNVYINNKELKEPYIKDNFTDGEVDVVVPEGEIFAMGDNRGNSKDSRSEDIGFINIKENIKGRVFVRLFPFNKIKTFKAPDYDLD